MRQPWSRPAQASMRDESRDVYTKRLRQHLHRAGVEPVGLFFLGPHPILCVRVRRNGAVEEIQLHTGPQRGPQEVADIVIHQRKFT